MKYIKEFEKFEVVNEGIISWVVGGFIALRLIKFIIKMLGMRKAYRTLVDSLLNTTRFNSGVKYPKINTTNSKIEKTDALEVSEYTNTYYLTFSGPYKSIENMRLIKDKRILSLEFNDKPVEISLSNKDYNEFIEIIKSKI